MTKPKLQKLWNDLTESCSPNILLDILQGQLSNAQVLIVGLNFLTKVECFIEFGRRSYNFGANKERIFDTF